MQHAMCCDFFLQLRMPCLRQAAVVHCDEKQRCGTWHHLLHAAKMLPACSFTPGIICFISLRLSNKHVTLAQLQRGSVMMVVALANHADMSQPLLPVSNMRNGPAAMHLSV